LFISTDTNTTKPGHEYTKGNVAFGIKVSQSKAVKNLEAFASANKQTQGKFTIGDEKQHNVFMRLEVGGVDRDLCLLA
jgi:hydroxyacylglutathione hydrolase